MKSLTNRTLGMIMRIFTVVLVVGLLQEVAAGTLQNGDFESGTLSDWTVFETLNGTLGGESFPRLVEFDVTGNGQMSKSAEFKVGQQQYQENGLSLAGGGILTNLHLDAGTIAVTADIASSYSSPKPKDRRNLAGGLFELLMDGNVIASHNFGPIANKTIQRFHLEGRVAILEGMHEVRIRIQRPFRSFPHDHAPRQYIDNIHLTFDPL